MLNLRLMIGAMTCYMVLTVFGAPPPRLSLETTLSQPRLLANDKQTAFLKVSLTALKSEKTDQRAPVNVALVMDESGSMTGEKIKKAKEAAIAAVGRLGSKDVISVVSYDSTVNVLLPAMRLRNKDLAVERINQLSARGDTALYAGVSKGAAEVRKNLGPGRVNRVVLISDGRANVGPSSAGELKALGRMLAKDGISVSTIGLGLGHNEDVMVQLAGASDGNYEFAENAEALAAVFEREFDDILSVVAQEVDVTITCAAGVTPLRVLGRDAEIIGQTITASINQLYGDREKYLLLEVEVPAGKAGEQRTIASVDVSYVDVATKKSQSVNETVEVVYSAKAEEIQKSLNKKVMASVVSQIGNATNMQALELRDQGQIEKAEDMLDKNAKYLELNALELGSPLLKEQSRENAQQKKALKTDVWTVNRKRMRASQYQRMMQQVPVKPVQAEKSKAASSSETGNVKK